ncbi:MAG: hypothetical protein F6K23_23335 [Okeania sp. SIO2C9]|uniref:hypothetical protein n=1 Tax=Okeania sp. SIO2C9 TaxID=2607791 RepID=UPI0013C03340|nr:hypothetical protein [Okeania sp. SIO2C9]NEQ75718.1 hypothetical protein [Okeania sp. SIO2C9]
MKSQIFLIGSNQNGKWVDVQSNGFCTYEDIIPLAEKITILTITELQVIQQEKPYRVQYGSQSTDRQRVINAEISGGRRMR